MSASLGHDLLDRVLTSLSDLTTLSAAIRVSALWFDTSQARQRSIVYAVLINAVGPTLLPALGINDDGAKSLEASDVTISRSTADAAVSQARIVQEIEDLLSWSLSLREKIVPPRAAGAR